MSDLVPTPLTIQIDESQSVSALWLAPAQASACYVFAHGAGAGMSHAFMNDMALRLAERRIATLRYQFPYMERQSRRVDSPQLAQAAVRAAVSQAAALAGDLPLFAGGKSFGGRMTSGAQAAMPLPGVRGLIFVGFPLHPAGKPSTARAAHLSNVQIPMLFIQGSRDALAETPLVEKVTSSLGSRALLHVLQAADHGLHVLVRSGRTDSEVMDEAVSTMETWMMSLA